jgi:hypothetical protein
MKSTNADPTIQWLQRGQCHFKQPDDMSHVGFSFVSDLGRDATITNVNWRVAGDATEAGALRIEQPTIDASRQRATCQLTGGRPGDVAAVTCRITASAGVTMHRSVLVAITDFSHAAEKEQ